MQTIRYYQGLAKQFIVLPLLLTLSLTFLVFLVVDLTHTIKEEIQHAQNISQILAKTASHHQHTLLPIIQSQTTQILQQMPQIQSITFYPIEQPHKINHDNHYSNTQLLFGKYLGLNTPVIAPKIANQAPNEVNQLFGYINISLDLAKIRKQWIIKNIPMFIFVLLITTISLILTLNKVKKRVYRLPNLTKYSQAILQDESININEWQQQRDGKNYVSDPLSLTEKAILHLLVKQQQQNYEIEQLNEQNQQLKSNQLQIIQQNSIFQNTLYQQFKPALDKITSGVRLLESQYISAEQQDAVNIINETIDGLNANLSQLLLMNHLEKNQVGIDLARFSPTQLLNDLVHIQQIKAEAKNIGIVSKIHHADFILSGDVQKIQSILISLLDNAVKFTDTGLITVTSELQHLQKLIRWQIAIKDTGIGIAEKYQTQIFEPFFQINPERRHSHLSQNVGLHLAQKLAEMMGGTLEFHSQEGEGSTFTLTLTLEDWNTHQQHLALKDKHITIWHKSTHTPPQAQPLSEAGATVSPFHDEHLLFNHIISKHDDALLITSDIAPPMVMDLIKKIREQEQHHRILMVYYYEEKFTNNIRELQISGVDYVEMSEPHKQFSEHYLEKLLHYLQ